MTGGRYQVLGHLASGGMGEILLARRSGPAGFRKLVVLKRPLAAIAQSPAIVRALIDEARLLAQVNHANVCQILDLEEADGEYLLVLEFLEGLSLWSILVDLDARGAVLEPRVACGLIEQACSGLEAIHRLRGADGMIAGVIHRDISPGNLFLTEDGTLKILDLGIAMWADATDPTGGATVRGKLPYLAPEQAAARALDARTDLFALGLVLHDLLRGKRPPAGRIGALAGAALPLAGLPAGLAEVVRRAVAEAPEARFASARAMAEALRAAAGELGGACSRDELAAWLASAFAAALAQQRARTLQAIAAIDDPTVVTRTLTTQSMLPAMSEPASAEQLTPPPAPRTEQLTPVPAPRTEQLTPVPAPRTEQLTPVPAPRTEQLTPVPAPRTEQLTPVPAPRTEQLPPVPLQPAIRATDPASHARGDHARRPQRRRIAIGAGVAVGLGVAIVIASRGEHVDHAARRTPATSISAPPAAISAPLVVTSAGSAAPPAPSPDPPASPPAAPPPAAAPPSAGRPRASEPHAARIATGLITIDSHPYATVTLGKQSLGHTPVFQHSVRAGRYTVRAAIPDGRMQELAIRVDAGRECRVQLRWDGSGSKRAGC